MSGAGVLALVVGPSGAGKDTLIAAARQRLLPGEKVVFVRRYITRDGNAGGEPHITISTRDFSALADRGGFALHWQAHGLSYGIPTSIVADLDAGRTVVANASRTVVPAARARFERLVIAHVTAAPAVRAARLAGRGRESEVEILRRLERAGVADPQGDDVVTIDNGGMLDDAVARFLEVIAAGDGSPVLSVD